MRGVWRALLRVLGSVFSTLSPGLFSPRLFAGFFLYASAFTLAAFTLAIFMLAVFTPARANPSIFPEDAAFATFGYSESSGGIGAALGFETRLPVRFLDVSAAVAVYAPLTRAPEAGSGIGFRVSGTALVFPAFGSSPPLALGVGADAGYGPDGVSLHAGPLVGTDLLFSLRLPMTASLYLAPGYASAEGFSLAWAAGLRYYFDAQNVALDLSSTDLTPLGLGVRVLF